MSEKSSQKDSLNNTVGILIIFSMCLIISLVWGSQLLGISMYKLFILFKKGLYFPNYNIFRIGEIAGINILELFYKFLLLTILIATTYFKFFTNQKSKNKNPSISQIVPTIGIVGLLLFVGVQQLQRSEYFVYEKSKLSGMTKEEKIKSFFGLKYQFPKICQKMLNEPHQGKFITDFDLSKDPYMFYRRLMSYYLYPKLSIRFENNSPKDCLVLYSNKSTLDKVPENYKVLVTAENANYVLAIQMKEK